MKAISLFSGAGGMDLGVEQAGFDILASVELDKHACSTLRGAIKKEKRSTIVLEEDITKLDPSELRKQLKLEPGELDLLCGGPPCQAFSQIGKRAFLEDDRGKLLFEMVRFANEFKPKAILIEQVKGLLNASVPGGRPGGVLDSLQKRLVSIGYTVSWRILNAADYGVPQKRERVFIMAVLPWFNTRFPLPKRGGLGLPSYVTVGDVLAGLPVPFVPSKVIEKSGLAPSLFEEPTDPNHVDVTPAGDRRRIHGVPEGDHLAAQHHLPADQRKNLTKKDTTKFRRLSRQEPSLTLRCGEIHYHPLEDRYLTPREYLRLHGYPDTYELQGPIRGRTGQVRYLDQHRQVANSVPPPLARAIAETIKEEILCPKSSRSLVML
jgi:DNA (cytosine-5)-methyltransferase 1